MLLTPKDLSCERMFDVFTGNPPFPSGYYQIGAVGVRDSCPLSKYLGAVSCSNGDDLYLGSPGEPSQCILISTYILTSSP